MHKDLQPTFRFVFPLIDQRTNPPQPFSNLHITATGVMGRLNNVIEVRITKITYFEPGAVSSSNVNSLIQFLNPEVYQQILNAAKSHGESNSFVKATDTVTIKFSEHK